MTFLELVFGVLFSVLLLEEPVSVGTFVGTGIILSSVALVTEVRFRSAKEKGRA
jgi:drug/metabolite transporter (DMT)-like permease